MRYSLKALQETVLSTQTSVMNPDWPGWSAIHSALSEACSSAGATVHARDEAGKALKWYVALLYLERARTVWTEQVGRPLASSTG